MNLLAETQGILCIHKQTPEDILYIGSFITNHACTWEEFLVLADIEYYSGFGGAEVALDLMIAFNNGDIMTRSEYDGSEWWKYTPKFILPEVTRPIKGLITNSNYLYSRESS